MQVIEILPISAHVSKPKYISWLSARRKANANDLPLCLIYNLCGWLTWLGRTKLITNENKEKGRLWTPTTEGKEFSENK